LLDGAGGIVVNGKKDNKADLLRVYAVY